MDLAQMGIGAAVPVSDDSYNTYRFSAIVAESGGCTVSFKMYARNGFSVVWASHAMEVGEFIVGDLREVEVTAGAATCYFQPDNLDADIT